MIFPSYLLFCTCIKVSWYSHKFLQNMLINTFVSHIDRLLNSRYLLTYSYGLDVKTAVSWLIKPQDFPTSSVLAMFLHMAQHLAR